MEWQPWGRDAFDRAARERKPVLLSIAAAWCRACHEMDRTTYADDRVRRLAADRFVAVRVDTDQRPDINDRYNLGGWPTTAFLTPEGEVLGGGTFVAADRMAAVLVQVADAFAALPSTAARPSAEPVPAGHGSSRAPGISEDDVFATFDERCGGFGIEPKFPLTAPLLLALALHDAEPSARWRAIVERTLDAMADGGLYDRASGGFYRYATTRDWQLPHVERLLETNAALLRAYVQSFVTLGRERDREVAAGLVRFIRGLAADRGGYAASDAGHEVYAASTAAAVSALLAAAAAFDDRDLARDTLGRFETFLLSAYRPGEGVAHGFDDAAPIRALLLDQVGVMDALLAAYATTGDTPYCMMAEELGLYTCRVLRGPDGTFVDRVPRESDFGLLRRPRQPFVANCAAAQVFARLARISKEPFADVAAPALAGVAAAAHAYGPAAAWWCLAAREAAIR
jgi:uncharacterized protein YyaL (SSP411 family)